MKMILQRLRSRIRMLDRLFITCAVIQLIAVAVGIAVQQTKWHEIRAKAMASLATRIVELEELYGFQIYVIRGSVDSRDGLPATRKQNNGDMHVFSAIRHIASCELERFPPTLISRLGPSNLVIASHLSIDGIAVAAFFEPTRNALYVTAEDVVFDASERGFQHELFHAIDHNYWGPGYLHANWQRLNDPKFGYGLGGMSYQQDWKSGIISDDTPGFITRYSQSGVREDRAEIFSTMITNPQIVNKIASRDAIIRAKIEVIRDELRQMDETLDEEWWLKIQRCASYCGDIERVYELKKRPVYVILCACLLVVAGICRLIVERNELLGEEKKL